MAGSTTDEDLTYKTASGLLRLTQSGTAAIAPSVTSITENVYAFTGAADAQVAAAAMARLSRNSNDLRTIIAAEFSAKAGKEIDLLRRVVNQFGDDSVMQLYPMQLVFEGVSNLATKEIEWGRLASYLEQSTRYLRFDHKDEAGRYAFVTPDEFDGETAALYDKVMTSIFEDYSLLYTKMLKYYQMTSDVPKIEQDGAWRRACHAAACDSVRGLLPAATKATVGVVGSAQAIHNMILHMGSHELPEMQALASKALVAARQVAPVFFERTDMPTRGALISGHRQTTRQATHELAVSLTSSLPEDRAGGVSVELLSHDGNEDELIAKILADTTAHSFARLRDFVATMSDKKKQQLLATYVGERYNRRAKPGRAFEWPHYAFEVQCDYGAFRDIQRHRLVDGLEWQALRPTLGYEVPGPVKDAGAEAIYNQVFAKSEALYNQLTQRGYGDQAQYATLFGHIMRFTVKMNARSLLHTAELRTSPQGHPNYRKVYQDMHAAISVVHPNIAAAMSFVSSDEDEALARLGAEKYNQAKYKQAS